MRLARMKKLPVSPKVLDYLIDARNEFRTNNSRAVRTVRGFGVRILADNFPQECSNRLLRNVALDHLQYTQRVPDPAHFLLQVSTK